MLAAFANPPEAAALRDLARRARRLADAALLEAERRRLIAYAEEVEQRAAGLDDRPALRPYALVALKTG